MPHGELLFDKNEKIEQLNEIASQLTDEELETIAEELYLEMFDESTEGFVDACWEYYENEIDEGNINSWEDFLDSVLTAIRVNDIDIDFEY